LYFRTAKITVSSLNVVLGSVPTVHVIQGTGPVTSLTTYNDQLFFCRHLSASIMIYDSTNFRQIGSIIVAGSDNDFYGLAPSLADDLLYASNTNEQKVYTVKLPLDTSTTSIAPTAKWSMALKPNGLSVNGANNVLVTMRTKIEEYTSNGTLVRRVPNNYYNFQAVEQFDGMIAVSSYSTLNAVSLWYTNGTFQNNYGSITAGSGVGMLNFPFGLAVDKDGFILVCDSGNNRVVVLNPTLSEARELPTSAAGTLNSPRALWLDQSKGRLYVGEYNSPCRVLVFENLFDISGTFNSWKVV
jgi:DNA-binding beta-propeller fold protein YncE